MLVTCRVISLRSDMDDFQDKKYMIIFDLEATCWAPDRHADHEMETIEIGAIKVRMGKFEVLDEFDSYIKPVRHPELSDFCISLTTITQAEVDSSDFFPAVFDRFVSWTGRIDEIILASWGNYDRRQLIQDCRHHEIDYVFGDDHINLKGLYAERRQGKKFGLIRALRLEGLKFEGTHHRAIDDARNILRLVRRL